MRLIDRADSPRHGAVFRERILQNEARHAHVELLARQIHLLGHVLVDGLEALRTVVVIRIDDHEGFVDLAAHRKHCLSCSPGLLSALRNREAFRQIVDFLEGIVGLNDLRDAVADDFLKVFLQILADDEDYLVKARALRIVNRIVHDDFAVRAHRRELLDAASETGTDSRGQHNQCRFHTPVLLSLICSSRQIFPAYS